MLPSYILSLREGLEAALIIGIVLGTLKKIQRRHLVLPVWLGAGSAILLSVLVAVILTSLKYEFKDPYEAVFEGLTMLLAAGILTWMIFWMSRQSRSLKADLESGVQLAAGGRGSLFGLAFLAVLREGIELALFVSAAAFATDGLQTILGTLLGLGTAILLGWTLFTTSVRLDLQRFFNVTGILLVFFAAGLVALGVHEFIAVGWIPAIVEHVWNINPILSEDSFVGQVLKALFGYNSSPSLTEVLSYLAYFAAVFLGLRKARTGDAMVRSQA